MRKNYYYLGLLSVTALSCVGQKSEQKALPNIVIIYADDMGYGDMSCQNPDSKIQTPNIDRLAESGLRFTDGHSSAGVSSPSRYAMLTGNYHWRRMGGIVQAFGQSEFEPNELTIPRMLQQRGYYTAIVGKWHLGWDWDSVLTNEAKQRKSELPKGKKFNYTVTDFDWSKPFKGGPCDQGFDYYFGDGTINFPPYCWVERDLVVEAPTVELPSTDNMALEGAGELRPGPAVEGWNVGDVLPTLTNKTLEVIGEMDRDKPFFLMCSLSAPHAPIVPSEEFHGKSDAGYYGDFVVQCDDIVGKIMDALKKRGLDENTIVIFSADNGPEKYAFDRLENFDHNSTYSLRGVKRDTWEGGHRVPFIVNWSGEVTPGVSEEVVNQVDLMATFAEIVGYDLPNDSAVDSYSLLSVLKNEPYTTPLREATIHNTRPNRYAIRKGDWVLIDSFSGTHSVSPESYNNRYDLVEYSNEERSSLLYNLKEDQMQRVDLSQQHPQLVTELKTLLERYRTEGRSIPNREDI